MISSKQLAEQINLDLDQNAYTTWHDNKKILWAINSACNFLHMFTKRPRTLELAKKEETTVTDLFTFDHEIMFPYWIELDWDELDRTNVPLVWRDWELDSVFYVNGNVIKTWKKWKVIHLLYHRGHNKLTSLWDNDLNIPYSMQQVLLHLALWFIYPGWLDIWSSLANQNYQMAQTLLTTYWKAYWFDMQPTAAKASGIYH